jgi:hypothetical protein
MRIKIQGRILGVKEGLGADPLVGCRATWQMLAAHFFD